MPQPLGPRGCVRRQRLRLPPAFRRQGGGPSSALLSATAAACTVVLTVSSPRFFSLQSFTVDIGAPSKATLNALLFEGATRRNRRARLADVSVSAPYFSVPAAAVRRNESCPSGGAAQAGHPRGRPALLQGRDGEPGRGAPARSPGGGSRATILAVLETSRVSHLLPCAGRCSHVRRQCNRSALLAAVGFMSRLALAAPRHHRLTKRPTVSLTNQQERRRGWDSSRGGSASKSAPPSRGRSCSRPRKRRRARPHLRAPLRRILCACRQRALPPS